MQERIQIRGVGDGVGGVSRTPCWLKISFFMESLFYNILINLGYRIYTKDSRPFLFIVYTCISFQQADFTTYECV